MCSQQSLPPGAGPVTVSTEISGEEVVGSDTPGSLARGLWSLAGVVLRQTLTSWVTLGRSLCLSPLWFLHL